MEITRQRIADAAMVSRDVVHKAVKSGRLDENSLVSLCGFIMMNRLGAGGLKEITGLSPVGEEAVVEKVPRRESVQELAERIPSVGAGMHPVNFTPSVGDGQSDEEWTG